VSPSLLIDSARVADIAALAGSVIFMSVLATAIKGDVR